MSHDEEAALRHQLVDARTRIIAQLDDLHYRATAVGFARRGGQPDYSAVIAELEGELRDINELLGAEEGGNA
jgi:hypothetical protein